MRRWLALAAVMATTLWVPTAWAQTTSQFRLKAFQGSKSAPAGSPVLLEADRVTYDQDNGVISAVGNVELSQGERILNADRVNYNEKDGVVTATGNVVLLEPGGEVIFSNYVELRDEMQNGLVQQMRTRLSDNSRMVAARTIREDGNKTYFDRVAYTPCNQCRDDPKRPPLWQIKAKQAVHDQEAQEIRYTDVVFEALGIPVAYSPFFAHPDPTVEAHSGLLPPDVGSETYFGMKYRQPYYWRIDDNRDATISTFITQKKGLQLYGEYREKVKTGDYWFDASGTYVDQYNSQNVYTGDKYFRGHIRGAGRFEYDENTTYGFNLFRSSDKTYPQLYHVSNLNTLTSHAFTKTLDDRNFLTIDSWSFQTLRPNYTQSKVPIVLPQVNYYWVGEPNKYGGYFGFDGNVLSLFRPAGTTTDRASSNLYWKMPFYTSAGEVYTFQARLRTDVYWANQWVGGGTPTTVNTYGWAGRVMPLISGDWRWPLVKSDGNTRYVIEPIAQAIWTPWGGNSSRIPNEDSQSYELDETNMFNMSRFPGLDRYDSGPRVNYGVRTGLYTQGGAYGEVLIGQSLRAGYNYVFAPGSGLVDPLSDVAGRVTVSPVPWLTFIDRFRVHAQSMTLERNEITAAVGQASANAGITYARLSKSLFTVLTKDQSALGISANAKFLRNWGINTIYLTDLSGGGTLRTMVGLRYTDECLDLLFYYDRSNVVDADVQPNTSWGVRFILANMG